MNAAPDLGERLARLEARAAIGDVMQVYAAAADRKYTALRQKAPEGAIAQAAAAQAACFTADALWQGGGFGGDLTGRLAIEGFFGRSPWLFTSHHYDCLSLHFDGTGFDRPEATIRAGWRLLEIGIPESSGQVALLTGAVKQDWKLTHEGWLIARMRFVRLHAVTLASAPEALRCLIPAGETL